ncbi:MAG: JAB domain-containing protein [Balneola sp.]|nr:JAB domain-containing protein [Balneola sp.]MBO6651437.1 JAB domain-containing protein [Balneola sp.]MBO6712526.1 JAB domain-containing protein [Balneola sp.]MBO6800981.1 JAB domain-containing protein [Balneola sp.]MBO6870653.1 JAB domain-containing protein [Balneola sp.]
MPIIAEVSLAYKSSQPVETLPTITSPEEAAHFLRSIWDQETLELREEFIVVLLNNAKKVLGWSRISTGGSTATIVEPSAVFQLALLGKADSIICAHNHPSGNLKNSQADISLTRRLTDAGKLLGITLDDHVILTQGGYLSLREEGLM